MNLSQYLYHHKNGNYYFRIRTPNELSHVIKTKEFKRSLGTKNKVTASRNALPYLSFLAKIKSTMDINKLLKDLKSGSFTGLGVKGFELGNLKIAELEIDPKKEGDVDAAIKFLKATVDTQPSLIDSDAKPSTKIRLKDIIEDFKAEKLLSKSCKPATLDENAKFYQLLLRILGDGITLSDINYERVGEVKKVLLKLPTNINKSPKYRDKTIAQILAFNDPPRSISTINKILNRYSELFDYIKRHSDIAENYFFGLTVKESKNQKELRSVFSPEQQTILFTELNNREQKSSYQYWLPRIALYTGMRLNEICQLHLNDIKVQDGIYLFDINDNDEKTLKNKASKRLIPIHSKLMNLGLIERVEVLRGSNETRLFPELTFNGNNYARAASRWFSEVRKPLGWVGLEPKLDFHSFRHTVATELQKTDAPDIPEYRIAAILGHEVGSGETFKRYGKGFKISTVKADIELLEFHQPEIHTLPPVITIKAPRKKLL